MWKNGFADCKKNWGEAVCIFLSERLKEMD